MVYYFPYHWLFFVTIFIVYDVFFDSPRPSPSWQQRHSLRKLLENGPWHYQVSRPDFSFDGELVFRFLSLLWLFEKGLRGSLVNSCSINFLKLQLSCRTCRLKAPELFCSRSPAISSIPRSQLILVGTEWIKLNRATIFFQYLVFLQLFGNMIKLEWLQAYKNSPSIPRL